MTTNGDSRILPFPARLPRRAAFALLGVGFTIALTACAGSPGVRAVDPSPAVSGPAPWSVRVADALMRRHPDSLWYPEWTRGARWDYEQGLVLDALFRLWQRTSDTTYLAYIRRDLGRYIGPGGTIRTYALDSFNLDNIATGRVVLRLWESTGEQVYRAAADTLRAQLAAQPRTPEGGFWHKKIYPQQMWLDGLFMAEPFYAAYTQSFGPPSAWDDIVHQFVLIEHHTRDSATGLLFHAWDAARRQRWADTATGHSPHFWGRAMGWYAMALIDVLDLLPADHPRRGELLAILNRLADALARYRDPSTGLWYQVVDQGTRPGNYLESSASCMFVYAFAAGARRGYLPPLYDSLARSSFAGAIRQFITVTDQGLPDIHDACQGAGLGGTPYRDGSFAYYVGERRRTNDFKVVGAFLFAALELEAPREAGR
jgi:unsaturated rhamnogalacturonyl hydrolase